MGAYLANKTFQMGFTLFGVVTLVFFLFNVLPGDPSQMMLGQNQNEQQRFLIKKKYGFDLPIELSLIHISEPTRPY